MEIMRIDGQRLNQSVQQLSAFSQGGTQSGVTRLPWTPEDRSAVSWLAERFQEVGCRPRLDSIGNLWAEWDVGSPSSLVMGSHRDSVPLGGAFDGALGVLAAIEVLRTLRSSGYKPSHNIEAVAWNDEEGARFGTTTFGSRAYVGAVSPLDVAHLQDTAGVTFRRAAELAGFPVENMRASTRLSRIRGYLELHIEQGPILERESRQIGVVEGIGALLQVEVEVTGLRLHAAYSGSDRQDPVLTAATALHELRSMVQEANRGTDHARVGVTVGRGSASSHLINVVPEKYRLAVDLRGPEPETVLGVLKGFQDALDESCRQNNTSYNLRFVNDHTTLSGGGTRERTIAFNRSLTGLVRDVAADLGYTWRSMPSWAGHDAMAMAPRVPTAMIFVPSARGLSHTASEFTLEQDVERGANVLLHALVAADQTRDIVHDWAGPVVRI